MTTDLLEPDDRAALARIQLLARDTVEGFCSGLHRSPHTGFSVEFKEHRPYTPGDDVRAIDWKLFGKTDRLFIREYEEETNLRCVVAVDCSGSMGYAGSRASMSKHAFACRAAAGLSYLLLRQQDGVGLMTFDETVNDRLPVRATPRHLSAILGRLDASSPGAETDLGGVLRLVAASLKGRGLVVLISDLFGDVESLGRGLSLIRGRGHEVVLLQVLDPDETDFPFQRWTEFRSLERRDSRRTLDPAQVRASYLRKLAEFNAQLDDLCGRQRVSRFTVTTDTRPAGALAAVLNQRRRPG